MTDDYYQLALVDRRRQLADAGFARDAQRIWSHADGRQIGEGIAGALTDEAFLRFVNSAGRNGAVGRQGQEHAGTNAA